MNKNKNSFNIIKIYPAFINCVKEYKNNIKNIKCPVFIIHGDDEIIPLKSSEWDYEQIPHQQKRCVYLHTGKHRSYKIKMFKTLLFF